MGECFATDGMGLIPMVGRAEHHRRPDRPPRAPRATRPAGPLEGLEVRPPRAMRVPASEMKTCRRAHSSCAAAMRCSVATTVVDHERIATPAAQELWELALWTMTSASLNAAGSEWLTGSGGDIILAVRYGLMWAASGSRVGGILMGMSSVAATDERRRKVVIIGGGFGGLACARQLDGTSVEVCLIDHRNFHLFTPLLYQVATALLNPSDITYPLRARFRRSSNVRVRQAWVTTIDLVRSLAVTHTGQEITFDWLVVASGSVNNYFGNEALENATLGMKTLEEALRLRNHVLSCLERASQERNKVERRGWLTFVIVGGGPTGVEYAGALHELLRLVLGRDYPDLDRTMARIILVEGREHVLDAFSDRLGRYAESVLQRMHVEVWTGTLVRSVTDDGAFLSDGQHIQTRTVVWAAGVAPDYPAGSQPWPISSSQRVVVDDWLRISQHADIFVIGDAASVREHEKELPMLSPVAMQQGRYVAQEILHRANSSAQDQPEPFQYRDKGALATIGRHAAVGTIGRMELTGYIGWLAWLVVHLYYLVGFRNRLAVFASWGWNYLRRDRPIRIIARAQGDPIADELGGG